MIANVAATSDQAEETISTCRFAQRVAMISNTVSPAVLPHAIHYAHVSLSLVAPCTAGKCSSQSMQRF